MDTIDMDIDGADEVDPQFRMIKGGGGPCCAKRSSLPRRAAGDRRGSREAGRSARAANTPSPWRSARSACATPNETSEPSAPRRAAGNPRRLADDHRRRPAYHRLQFG